MSPNANYVAGVRFERERMKHWLDMGADAVMRTAGSHGPFDVIVIRNGRVTMIQCKVVRNITAAETLLEDFRESPPINHPGRCDFHQTLEVKVKGSTEVHSVTV